MKISTDELLFFNPMPQLLPIYEELKTRLEARYPEITLRVTKTQISFRSRYVFAMVSLPYRRKKDWPREYLMISFGLDHRVDSPRIVEAVEAYPNRWTHHVLAVGRKDIDERIMNWLDEAYNFSMIK